MSYFKNFYIDGKKVKTLYLNGKKVKLQESQVLGPLCFTSTQADSTVTMIAVGSAPTLNLKYSIDDGETWGNFTVGVTTIHLQPGEKAYFKANGTNAYTATSSSNYNKFVLSGQFAASGNVNSLLTDDPEEALTLSLADKNYCYVNLFKDCVSLTTAPALPSTILAKSCYSNMFNGCSNLTNAPELPATELANICYGQMFSSCSSLTTAPELPATALALNCYANMFNGCTSLTSAPTLPATTLAVGCYSYMFYNCSSLKISETAGTKFLDIPTGTTAESNWNYEMFANTGGTFTGDPQIGRPYYYY